MTGGGTLGPVTPLLAIVDEWRRRDAEVKVSWLGTKRGPERQIVEAAGIEFAAMFAPKLNRHQLWQLPLIPILLFVSCLQAFRKLREIKPDLIFSAGGYVSVPIVWMGWLLRIPSWVHQLDVQPGLANKLMAPFARKVSVTWKESATAFPARKTEVVGGLVRQDVARGQASKLIKDFHFDPKLPLVLIFGGGTGALSISRATSVIATELATKANVLLLTGSGKMAPEIKNIKVPHFAAREILVEEMKDALRAADVIVGRAGMGTIAEAIALRKPLILIPIPGSHQEHNAKILQDRQAAIVIHRLTPQLLFQAISNLLASPQKRHGLSQRLGQVVRLNAHERIVDEARQIK